MSPTLTSGLVTILFFLVRFFPYYGTEFNGSMQGIFLKKSQNEYISRKFNTKFGLNESQE